MDQNFFATLAASLIAGTVTTAGIYTIRRFEAWARQDTTYFACFAAGVLIAVSFLHIVPRSFAMSPEAPVWLFAGYLLMHLFNRFITAHVCDKPATAEYALGLVPLLGIGFHSFLDGIVYSIGFSVSTLTGSLVALGMVLHEFPEGIVIALLRQWTDGLAAGLRALGIRAFPTEAYFFLADFAAHDARQLAGRLEEHGILVKPLNDERLGPGFIRVTTALPEDNARFLSTLREFL